MAEKRCIRCRLVMPADVAHFHRDRGKPDGLHRYCRECGCSKARLWGQLKPERQRQKKARYDAQHPARVRAQQLVAVAVRDGRIRRRTRCEQCRNPHARLQAHHVDYRKPLLVIWLCPSCHRNQHRTRSRKPACHRGHAFTPENTYRYPNGARRCRECSRIRYLVRRMRRAA